MPLKSFTIYVRIVLIANYTLIHKHTSTRNKFISSKMLFRTCFNDIQFYIIENNFKCDTEMYTKK